MFFRLAKVFLIAPFNVMIVVPGIILLLSDGFDFARGQPMILILIRSIIGFIFLGAGISICFITFSLLVKLGEGTPAPWDPPRKLVTQGIYSLVRNPMMIGVFLVLFGEAVLFFSIWLFIWFLAFLAGCLILFPQFEEPGLDKAFGPRFLAYKNRVPRWLPKKNPLDIENLDK